MSFYYPQAAVTLNILFEDFEAYSDPSLQKTYAFHIQAKALSVNINDYKTSDTFDCEVDYKSFPFDPRTIRSAQVTIHIQDMGGLLNEDGTHKRIVPTQANTVFIGFVDEETISLDESKRTVRFQGRDLTALLIDQKYVQNAPIFPTQPLDVVLSNLLAAFPATKKLKVINDVGGKLPTIASFYPRFGDPLAGGKNVSSHETYWDIIQDLAARCGLICFMHLDELHISSPRIIYSSFDASDPEKSYRKAIRFTYGKNMKNLSFKRKLGRHKGFNVLVRALAGKKVIAAKIPKEATASWCKQLNLTPGVEILVPKLNPNGSVAADTNQPAQYLAFRMTGVGNQAALVQRGQQIYEELIRQDLEGSFETMEMVGHSGDQDADPANYQVFDLTSGASNGQFVVTSPTLPLDIGQPIAVEIGGNDLQAISRLATYGARVQYLTDRGYDQLIANQFASTLGKLAPVFYTSGFSLTLDETSGFKLKVNFINYLVLQNRGLK